MPSVLKQPSPSASAQTQKPTWLATSSNTHRPVRLPSPILRRRNRRPFWTLVMTTVHIESLLSTPLGNEVLFRLASSSACRSPSSLLSLRRLQARPSVGPAQPRACVTPATTRAAYVEVTGVLPTQGLFTHSRPGAVHSLGCAIQVEDAGTGSWTEQGCNNFSGVIWGAGQHRAA